jgi:ankyrin repeat protein
MVFAPLWRTGAIVSNTGASTDLRCDDMPNMLHTVASFFSRANRTSGSGAGGDDERNRRIDPGSSHKFGPLNRLKKRTAQSARVRTPFNEFERKSSASTSATNAPVETEPSPPLKLASLATAHASYEARCKESGVTATSTIDDLREMLKKPGDSVTLKHDIGGAAYEATFICGKDGGVNIAHRTRQIMKQSAPKELAGPDVEAAAQAKAAGRTEFLGRLKDEGLTALAEHFKNARLDEWPSIDELARRLNIPADKLERLKTSAGKKAVVPGETVEAHDHALHAALMYLDGAFLSTIDGTVASAFRMARATGVEAAQVLMKRKLADADAKLEDGRTLLEEMMIDPYEPFAVPGVSLKSCDERISALLDAGADANQLFSDGTPPLARVRTQQRYDELVKHGAKHELVFDMITATGDRFPLKGTALHLAQSPESAEILLANGAMIDAETEPIGYTPLLYACKQKRFDVAKALIQANADVNVSDPLKATCLHFGPPGEVVELLLDHGADPNAVTRYERATTLHVASDKKAVQALVPRFDTDWTGLTTHGGGNSVLNSAAKRGNLEVVREFKRLDTDKKMDRYIALRNTAEPEIVGELFPRHGEPADALEELLNASDCQAWSADAYYFAAMQGGDPKLIGCLIDGSGNSALKQLHQNGFFDPEVRPDKEVLMPGAGTYSLAGLLMRTCPNDYKSLLDLIDTKRLDVGAKDSQGRGLLVLATRCNCPLALVEGLVDRAGLGNVGGAFVNAKGPGGLTPLHHAASHGNVEVFDYLVRRGGNPEQADDTGKTPRAYMVQT